MSIAEQQKMIAGMSIEQLKTLNAMVVGEIKERREDRVWEMKNTLQVGQTVKVNHPKMFGKTLRVDKINRTKAKLSVINGGGTWNVPLSMIEII